MAEQKLDTWTSIEVALSNQNCYEIVNVIPNSQYHIQVTVANNGINKSQQGNMINTLTPESCKIPLKLVYKNI